MVLQRQLNEDPYAALLTQMEGQTGNNWSRRQLDRGNIVNGSSETGKGLGRQQTTTIQTKRDKVNVQAVLENNPFNTKQI